MGRPGMSGGGHHSSGGHSSIRSSGGHHVSSGSHSSRPTGSGSYHCSGSTFRGSGFGGGGYYRPPRHIYYGTGGHYRGGGPFSFVVPLLIVIILFAVLAGAFSSTPASTRNRVKIENSVPYNNNCVIDELGYIENTGKVSRELQYFYNKTGIQPYIYLKAYDSSLQTDNEKEQYASVWYDKHIDNEDTFLYMYFADPNENDVGYMAYVNGKQVSSVMDAEAVDIFWNYIDRYWTDSSLSMNDVFIKSYTKTADTIMTKSTTKLDIGKWVAIGIVVLIGGTVTITIVRMQHKRAKEKAEETERILNTPLDETDDMKDKYL